MYTVTYDQIMPEFGSSRIVATLGLSFFIWGLGMSLPGGCQNCCLVADPLLQLLGLCSWVPCPRLASIYIPNLQEAC